MATKRNLTPTQQRYIDENRAKGCEAEVFWHAPLDQCLAEIRRVYAIRRKGEMGRRYYYALLTAGLLKTWAHVYEPNGVKSFDTSIVQAQAWVSGILTAARRNGTLPWAAVYDDSRSSWSGYYMSLESDIRTIGRSGFSLNPWLSQKKRVEVWVEKEDAYDMVLDICRPYQVPVNSAKGFGSADPFHKAAQRYGTGRDYILYWLGDFDPSGMGIEQSFYDILWEEGCRAFHATRLAVTAEQARTLNPIAAQELKRGDSRYKSFVAEYGEDAKGFELDAYPTDQLERDLKAVILSHIDPGPWNEAVALEREVRAWVTREAQALLGDQAQGWGRELRSGHLINPKTGEPFGRDTLALYLGDDDDDDDDGDDDGESHDGDDNDDGDDEDPAITEAIMHAMDEEPDDVREAWLTLQAAVYDPTFNYDEQNRLTLVWARLYAQQRGMTIAQTEEQAGQMETTYKESFIESNAQAIASGDIDIDDDPEKARLLDIWYRLYLAIKYEEKQNNA